MVVAKSDALVPIRMKASVMGGFHNVSNDVVIRDRNSLRRNGIATLYAARCRCTKTNNGADASENNWRTRHFDQN